MKIAVLHAGHAPANLISKYGDYDAMSKALLGLKPHESDTFTVLEGEFPKRVKDYDLYIITGSPCGAYEAYAWISELEDFIRKAFEVQVKLIGLCFGHQIIAQAMGGAVAKSDKGYGIGVLDYHLTYPSLKDQNIALCAWHQDQVIKQPPHSNLILTSNFCPIAGLTYGQQAMSFQPHPEFSRAFLNDMILVRQGDTITDNMAVDALATLCKDTDASHIQKILKSFINVGSGRSLATSGVALKTHGVSRPTSSRTC